MIPELNTLVRTRDEHTEFEAKIIDILEMLDTKNEEFEKRINLLEEDK